MDDLGEDLAKFLLWHLVDEGLVFPGEQHLKATGGVLASRIQLKSRYL